MLENANDLITTDRAGMYAAFSTLALVLAQWVTSHMKGRKRDRTTGASMLRVEKKLDGFIETQQETNRLLDKRIDAVSAHVIGPDGQNGLRSRVQALEDAEEKRSDREKNPIMPTQVGTFDRRAAGA